MDGTTEPPDHDLRAATRPGRQDDIDFPADTPPEVQPQQQPSDNPQAPDEIVPGQGDTDQPDSSPIETPEPPETPAAPD